MSIKGRLKEKSTWISIINAVLTIVGAIFLPEQSEGIISAGALGATLNGILTKEG
jgi:uncharacterized membrane protein